MEPPSPTSALVWLVTGTSSGLGLALSQHILRQGHNLISISRQPTAHPSLTSIRSGSLTHMPFDLSQSTYSNTTTLITRALSIHSRIDILINNAGTAHFSALEKTTPSTIESVMTTNFLSAVHLIQNILGHFRTHASPIPKTIVNISSTQGLCSDAGETFYDASKHALEGMTESLAKEVAPFKIRVGIVELGAFKTSLVDRNFSLPPGTSSVADEDVNEDPYSGPTHPVRQRIDLVTKYGGNARGDPAKAARLIYDAVLCDGVVGAIAREKWDVSRPGGMELLRLVLGADAHAKIERRIDALRGDLLASGKLKGLTDRDDL